MTKYEWIELSYYLGRLVDVVKEYGCGHGSNKREEGGCCVPECRFYRQYGRIEDKEVIALRQENTIVEPPSESQLLRMAKKYGLHE